MRVEKVLVPLAQTGDEAIIVGGSTDKTGVMFCVVVSELQNGEFCAVWYARTMNGGVIPQFTVMQFPEEVRGVPPVIIQLIKLPALNTYIKFSQRVQVK